MPATIDVPAGGYRYSPGVFQVLVRRRRAGRLSDRARRLPAPSAAASRVRFHCALFAGGRPPPEAFCACELRSPAAFTDDGFRSFNRHYVGTLERWRIMRDDDNPVARSNVCPELHKPGEPGFHAFCFTRPVAGAAGSFVIAGSGEAEEGHASYRERTVRYGDTSPQGLREKARFVLARMEQRMAAFGAGWAEASAVQVYTVHDLHPFLSDEIARRGAAQHGLTWHFARPPVIGLEYQMDCRSVPVEHRVAG